MAIPGVLLPFTVTFCFLVLIDILGNILVCIVILTNHAFRTPMYYLLVNLAVADIVVAIFQAWRYILVYTFEHPTGQDGKIMCTFLTGGTLTWVGGLTSAYTLVGRHVRHLRLHPGRPGSLPLQVVIAVERYTSVTRPSSCLRLNMRKLKFIVASLWVFAALFSLPLLLTRLYSSTRNFCIESWPDTTIPKVYAFCWLFMAGLIPVGVMGGLYFRIVVKVWFTKSEEVESAQNARVLSRKRFTKILILVTAIYAVCWLPVLIVYTVAQYGPTYIGSTIHNAGIILLTLNSTVNPLLYTFNSKKFRMHLKKALLCDAPLCLRLRESRVTPDTPNTQPQILFRGKYYAYDRRLINNFVINNRIKDIIASSVAEDKNDFKVIPEFLSVAK
ncbi:allatostatin-A receptor [Nematostella vectensis]|uniref:allatostatin-A receptor n=1 Tax=Nematostella vectensis TaxID=45351 RepID=UPI002076F67D|nr:allatostatin-A receptor [Nematostella vectensis]